MPQDAELAILFADVVGSTRLFELLGDVRARDLIATCIDIMRRATDRHRGTVIKTMGDEVMATFPSADDAINAACQMQKQIGSHASLQIEGLHIAIRVGCHFGPVVLENRDVFGAVVHTANRMTSQAKAGQIITTSATVQRLSPEGRSAVRQVDVASIRGQGGEVALYEVLWQPDDATSMLPQISLGAPEKRGGFRARVHGRGMDIVLDAARPSLSIGRADDCDLVIKGHLISRLHARLEVTRGKCVLYDESTNGTFVQGPGGELAFVRRDSLQLRGQGWIGLGKAPEPDSSQSLAFSCEED
jgi:class 3 adenylate cyclase